MPDFLRGTITDIGIPAGEKAMLYQNIIEFQKQTNPILQEMILKQCNSGSVEKATVRTALPEIAWRMFNKGVKPSKGGRGQISFTTGMMEALAQLDEDEVKLNGGDEYRLSENRAFQIRMNNTMAQTLFYGDEKINPAGFTGLGAYYYSLDPTKCKAANYVLDAGGTGNALTSLWLVGWDTSAIHGIFPEGFSAGFEYRDNGRQKVYDDEQNEYYVMESQYKWHLGLAVKDYRQAARMANIDVTQTITDAAIQTFIHNMIEMYNRIENINMGKFAFYCNRKVKTLLDKMAQDKFNVNLYIDSYAGKPTTQFWGIPIRVVDAIMNTEGQVI